MLKPVALGASAHLSFPIPGCVQMLNRILCFALVAGTATTCFGQFISYGNTYNSSPAYTSYYSTPPAYSGPFTVYKSGRRADYVFHGYIYPVYPDHTGSVGHRRLPGQWWDGAHYPASTLPPYLSYGQVDHSPVSYTHLTLPTKA